MEEIAVVYARSLFEVAKDQDKLDVVRDQLGAFADALTETRELQVFFFSPYFSTRGEEGRAGARRLGRRPGGPELPQAADREAPHAGDLPHPRATSTGCGRRRTSCCRCEITSAVELDESIAKQLGDRIEEQTGRKVELSSRVEPDILGGIVVQVGNSVLDASIRNRLEQLRRQVARA